MSEESIIINKEEITKETLEKYEGKYIKSLNFVFYSNGFNASSLGECVFWMDKPLTPTIIKVILSKDWDSNPELVKKINAFIIDEVEYECMDRFRSDDKEKKEEYIYRTVNEITYNLDRICFSTDEEIVAVKKFRKNRHRIIAASKLWRTIAQYPGVKQKISGGTIGDFGCLYEHQSIEYTHQGAGLCIGVDKNGDKYDKETTTDTRKFVNTSIQEYAKNPENHDKFDIITMWLYEVPTDEIEDVGISLSKLLKRDGILFIGYHEHQLFGECGSRRSIRRAYSKYFGYHERLGNYYQIYDSWNRNILVFKKPLIEPEPVAESSVKPDTTCDCAYEYGYESSDYDSDIEDRYNYVFGPAGGPNPGIWGVGE